MKSITIFTIPKTFGGLQNSSRIEQDNAIISWRNLRPKPDIILYGNDPGVYQAAERFGALNHPTILKTPLGTPLVSEAFKYVDALTSADLTAYVNCDIITPQVWMDAVQLAADQLPEGPFVLVGQRWDVEVGHPMNYDCSWCERLNAKCRSEGRRHGTGGSDYFVFPRGSCFSLMPPFAVGRCGWDNWSMSHAVSLGIPLVDLSRYALVYHQGILPMRDCRGVEDRTNMGFYNEHKGPATGNITDATHFLTDSGELITK